MNLPVRQDLVAISLVQSSLKKAQPAYPSLKPITLRWRSVRREVGVR
jgi:hypothetical protein